MDYSEDDAADRGGVSVALNIGIAPHPEYTLEVAGAIAEGVRLLNHHTRDHAALQYPAEVDRLIRELSSAAGRLPQLLAQVGAWLEREDAAERVAVPSGEYQGNPLLAVATARLRLDRAQEIARDLAEALDFAASVTSGLAAAETGEDDADG